MSWLTNLLSSAARPFAWWVVVAPWEAALRIRMGRKVAVLNAGLHFKIPYVDRIYRQSLRLRTISDSGVVLSSSDGRTVVVTLAIEFSIASIEALYNNMATPEETLLARATREAVLYCRARRADQIEPVDLADYCGGGDLEDDAARWGLGDYRVHVTSFAICRTYRIISSEYRAIGDFDVECHEDE